MATASSPSRAFLSQDFCSIHMNAPIHVVEGVIVTSVDPHRINPKGLSTLFQVVRDSLPIGMISVSEEPEGTYRIRPLAVATVDQDDQSILLNNPTVEDMRTNLAVAGGVIYDACIMREQGTVLALNT